MASTSRYPAQPVREVRAIPAPDTIPEGTSPDIAASIRRNQLEAEQARILHELTGLTPAQARRQLSNARRKYTAHAKRRARITEGDTFTRAEIITRDQRTCYLCGHLVPHADIHIDHDIPLSRGGTHTRDNVHVACSSCNLAKRNMTSSEYRATLRSRSG